MKNENIIQLKSNNRIIYLIMLLLILSCDSFLDVDLPDSQLIGVSVFENEATANAAVVNILADIRDKGILTGSPYGVSLSLGLYSDELSFYGQSSLPTFEFSTNTLLPNNLLVENYWTASYKEIYAVNALIDGLDHSQSLSDIASKNLKGEALFLRALLHFYLVNLYGDIPYINSTDYKVNSSVTRKPVKEIYELIESDLIKAIDYLPEFYNTDGRARPNKSTAIALLSRIYLYTNEWVKSEIQATHLLNNAMYNLEQNPESVFLKESTETIWQLPPAINGDATSQAYTFTIFSGPPTLSAISQGLLNSFEEEDKRKTQWLGKVTNGNDTWYYSTKYKQVGIAETSSEFSIILRLAEVYLIRAEARAYLGNLEGAKDDLNKVRLRAGLSEVMGDNLSAILNDILEERKKEFFTEHGHRFFDLKRLEKLDEKLSPIKPGWDTDDRLFPIPENELSVNPNLLPQNPGY